jgi:rod shape-determining protein MreD
MRSPQYLLLPAKRGFITVTLIGALVLNMLPWGRTFVIPDFMALVLVFWNIHQPSKVGIGISFLFGLMLDVHDAALLGEHALAYSILAYAAIALHRRVPGFHPLGQMIHVLPLFILSQGIVLLLRVLLGAPSPGFGFFLQSLTTTLLWPLADVLLLAPQRRAHERDETRPL